MCETKIWLFFKTKMINGFVLRILKLPTFWCKTIFCALFGYFFLSLNGFVVGFYKIGLFFIWPNQFEHPETFFEGVVDGAEQGISTPQNWIWT